MKLLLTSAGVCNDAIRDRLVETLGKPISECDALAIPTGSMVMTPRIGEDFVGWTPPSGGDETLGLADFSIYPHIDSPGLPDNTMEDARRWAETIDNPAYAIDDETAISVVDGQVDVVSEGEWTRLQ